MHVAIVPDHNLAQSLKAVKDALAKEEDTELENDVPLNQMTASTYISAVIALEDQKYVSSFESSYRYILT